MNRLMIALSAAAALGLVAYTVNAVETAEETVISGPARVIDGRFVSVDRTWVFLEGVDAAELGTPWGNASKDMLSTIATGEITCRLTGEKTIKGREIGRLGMPERRRPLREVRAAGRDAPAAIFPLQMTYLTYTKCKPTI